MACGGNTDKSGHVHRDTLVKIIKKDFGLPINIEVGAISPEITVDALCMIFATDVMLTLVYDLLFICAFNSS